MKHVFSRLGFLILKRHSGSEGLRVVGLRALSCRAPIRTPFRDL